MSSNILSRFLPAGADAGEPSIYETLRQQDELDELDVEENAGMGVEDGTEERFQDYDPDIVKFDSTQNDTGLLNAESSVRRHSQIPHTKPQDRTQAQAPMRGALVEDLDDEVPQSLLIEGRDEALPAMTAQRQVDLSPPVAGPSNPGTNARWRAAQAHQRLHLDTVPPRIRPRGLDFRSKGGNSLDPKEKALWMWTNVSNLDIFLKDVYDYYTGNGIWSITLSRMLNLL